MASKKRTPKKANKSASKKTTKKSNGKKSVKKAGSTKQTKSAAPKKAGAALGPYTPVVRAGDWVIVSGQLGIADGKLVPGGVAGQGRGGRPRRSRFRSTLATCRSTSTAPRGRVASRSIRRTRRSG